MKQLQLPTDFLHLMVADFARQAPGALAPLTTGAYFTRLSKSISARRSNRRRSATAAAPTGGL